MDTELAGELAQNLEVGNVLAFPSPGVHFVVGDQGAGKSLAAERLLQHAIEKASQNSSEPFPIHQSARGLRASLMSTIEVECQGYADPYRQPVFLVIDGLDELGVGEGKALLRDINIYARANPDATIVVTTRPLPGLEAEGNQIAIPPLDDEQIVKLLRLVSGQPLEPIHVQGWPDSMREVAKYPLFAIMIGSRIRENPEYAFSSRNQLIEHLAEDALDDARAESDDLDRLLHILAVRSITDGKPVHLHLVDRRRRAQRIIATSRLVVESSGAVDFALSIFREWYAARALLEGTIRPEEIERASDRWTIPFAMVLNSGDEEVIDSLLTHLASTDPGLAGRLLDQHQHEHTWAQLGDQTTVPTLESPVEVGVKLKKALMAWKQGLGILYQAIGPVKPDGDMKALSVGVDGRLIMNRWHNYRESESSIDVIPREEFGDRSSAWSVHGMEVPNTEAWSWLFTWDYLADRLKRQFADLTPGVVSEDAVRELSWALALDVNGEGALARTEIEISEVLDLIGEMHLDEPGPITIGATTYSYPEVDAIRKHLDSLLARGASMISDPWPSFDLELVSGRQMEQLYSDQRLLDRTNAIYSGALSIYSDLVSNWFIGFSDMLGLFSMMPVELEGRLIVAKENAGRVPMTSLNWRPKILPLGEESMARFKLWPMDFYCTDETDRYFAEEGAVLASLRDKHVTDIYPLHVTLESLDPVLELREPATKLARDWLRSELRNLGWGWL